MTERFQRQLPLPISDNVLTQLIHREPLVDGRWIEENSLPPGINSDDPEVFRLMNEGVRPCEIVILRLGR